MLLAKISQKIVYFTDIVFGHIFEAYNISSIFISCLFDQVSKPFSMQQAFFPKKFAEIGPKCTEYSVFSDGMTDSKLTTVSDWFCGGGSHNNNNNNNNNNTTCNSSP